MSSVLPIIEMPKKEPDPVIASLKQEIPDNKLPEQVGNMELIDELMKENNCDLPEDDIITVDEREIPGEDEVFSDRPPPKVSQVLEEPEEPVNEFTPKKGKRKYVRKAPMSDKQKDHLAKIRKIAQDKRKLERERKAQEKEDKLVEKAEQKILQKKQKEEELSNPKPEPKIVPKVNNGFTKEDLDSAVLSAISQYDTLRKQQKKEKRESEIKKNEEEKMRATLARAIQPQARTAPDPWRNLFN
mgnify:CR=1 FL=1